MSEKMVQFNEKVIRELARGSVEETQNCLKRRQKN